MQFVQFNGATRKQKGFFPIKSTGEDKNTALLTLRRIDRLNITYNYLSLFKQKYVHRVLKAAGSILLRQDIRTNFGFRI